MKTVFVYANKMAISDFNDPQEEVLKAFEDTALPTIAEHVVIFPLESKDEDLTEFHEQVVAHAAEHGEADVFFYIVDASQLRIVLELSALSSEIIFH